jgi:hypothetical protein
MARVPDLIEFCKEHRLKMITVADLIHYRMAHERSIHRNGAAVPSTSFLGHFQCSLTPPTSNKNLEQSGNHS